MPRVRSGLLPIESTFDLSEDEYKRVQVHADRLFSLWTDTSENDVEAIEGAIKRMYARERCSAPFIFWCDSLPQLQMMPTLLDTMADETFYHTCAPVSPQDPITNAFNRALSKANLTWPAAWQARVIQIVGAQRVAQWRESCARARLLTNAKIAAEDAQSNYSICWGRWAADLLPVYATPALALASGDWAGELLAQLADLFTLRCGAFAYVFRHSSVFVCKNPTKINLDAQNRLHCDDGPALEFADGHSLYAWAGVNIDPELVLHPESMTADRIDNEPNIELRRVMIEKYGTARYVEDTGAMVIGEDDCGVLLRKEVPGDEPILMVKVINSTAEADGTFKEYFLRVPPDINSAREGIAWTFGLDSEEYAPYLQT
jgi:hypothetical protein